MISFEQCDQAQEHSFCSSAYPSSCSSAAARRGTAGPQPPAGIFVPSPNVAAKALVKPGRGAGSEQEAARELQEVALQLLGKGKLRGGWEKKEIVDFLTGAG